MQSWGTRSRFDHRDTEMAPSKSGVVGLIAAALGRGRDERVTDLAALRLGVRIDRPGTLLRDYHTAKDVLTADGKGMQDTAVTHRAYLADAVFLVGLESRDRGLLESIDTAVADPRWPLALGRRSFPPGSPVALRPPHDPMSVVDVALETALVECPPLTLHAGEGTVRYLTEDSNGEQSWFDQPLDNFRQRTFGLRRVKVAVAEWGAPWS